LGGADTSCGRCDMGISASPARRDDEVDNNPVTPQQRRAAHLPDTLWHG